MRVQANEIVKISFPLSASQQSIWLHQKFNPRSNAYNIPVYFSIDSTVNDLIIKNTVTFILNKYDILRVQFQENEGVAYQTVCDLQDNFKIDFFLESEDLNKSLNEYVNKTFDIEKFPLFRFAIIQTTKKEKYILMVFHHLITDGTSLYLFAQEIRQSIELIKRGHNLVSEPLGISYQGHVILENERINSEENNRHKNYWLGKLEGELPYLTLPYDLPYNPEDRKGASKRLLINESTKENLERISEKSKSSLYNVLLAGFVILLHRLTGERDIIIGNPVINRDSKTTSKSQGLFLNTIILRNYVDPEIAISQFLKQTQSALFQALRHRSYPFSKIVNDLKIKSDTDRFPISSIFFNGLTFFDDTLKEEAFEAFSDNFELDINFDIDCYITYSKEKLIIRFDYRRALFKEDTIDIILHKYRQILEQICTKYDQPIREINYNTLKIPDKVLHDAEWYNQQTSIIDVFYQQVEKYPQNIAVITNESNITYQQLNEITNQWGRYLFQITNETRVAICISHGLNMAIAVLTVLKSGKVYIPIDPAYPESRRTILLQEAKTSLIIADNTTIKAYVNSKAITVINIDNYAIVSGYEKQNLSTDITSASEAYIMYTSGSTGKPKGVIQLHKNVLHFISQYASALNINPNDKLTGFSPITYDSFNNDFYGALLNGAAYCPISLKDNETDLGKWVNNNNITIWHSVPGIFRMCIQEWLLHNIRFENLRIIKMTGELVRLEDFENFKKITVKNAKFVVSIGSTESTLTCINLFGHDNIYDRQVMPVGFPVARTNVYILNDNGEELDILEPGEIVVESNYFTPGYFNNSELDRTVFYRKNGKRFYRTGDIGRMLIDGRIEWISRIDFQLKINGIRLEPGEIENHLVSYKDINEALVVLINTPQGEKQLCAYYTSAARIEEAELVKYLSKYMPLGVIPSYFIRLDKFFYNLNGKLDRKALPEPENKNIQKYIAPRNQTEEKLTRIFSEIIGLESSKISIKDSFFHLGGHSLKAINLIHRLHKEFNKRLELKEVFNNPSIEELAKKLKTHFENAFEKIKKLPEQNHYELSHAQQRLWILTQLSEASVAYHISNAIMIKGKFDVSVFHKAILQLIKRHEILRTGFAEIADIPYQKVLQREEIDFKTNYEDLSKYKDKKERAKELLNQESVRPFDFTKAPLMRALVVKLEDNEYILLLTLHHIISDGWSMEVIINEIRQLYNSFKKGEIENLLPLNIQFKDYSSWHNNLLRSEQVQEHRTYWLNHFHGEIPVLDLPTSKPRPLIQTYNGNQISAELSKELTKKINEFSLQHDATLFMTFLAIIKTLLFRYTGQTDIIVGTAIAGRDHIDLEQQIGFYVNTLALRTQFEEIDTFESLLKKIKGVSIEAFEHSLYTFDYLVDDLKLNRDLSRSPIFDVLVVLQNVRNRKKYITGFEGLELKPFYIQHTISKFDITFNIVEINDVIRIDIEYNTDIFSNERVKKIVNHLISVANIVMDKPKAAINSFNYLPEVEKKQMICEFNDTTSDFPKEKTIVNLFEIQVQKTPEDLAVQYGIKSLTYKELNKRSDQLAYYLQKNKREDEEVIALMVDRSIEMIICLYGILKSGCAYLPIDPEYPQERIAYMLEHSGAKIMITEEGLEKKLSGIKINKIFLKDININESNCRNLKKGKSTDIAYLIYTSGSTGKPKGIVIEHRSIINFMSGVTRKIPFEEGKSILSLTTISFDIFVLETFLALSCGLNVIIGSSEEQTDANKIAKSIIANNVEMLQLTPSRLKMILSSEDGMAIFSRIKTLMVGGEALSLDLLNELKAIYKGRIFNMYGPTETTVWSTIQELTNEDKITIGKPISNTQIYILDKQGNIQPIGIAGEICIGGAGLARGYWNDENQTKEKFISNPFKTGARIYRTGDLGRWLPNGNIEFLGRTDHQVKIRGNRIELGEIESALIKHEKVREAVVVARGTEGEKYLCAYMVTHSEVNKSELRSFLSKSLPEYMLPSYFVTMTKLPLTPNGKIDRKAFPDPDIQKEDTYQAPVNNTESKLTEIWSEVLNIDSYKIGTNKSFFELGGHSLKAIKMLGKIHKEFHKQISIATLFSNPTVKGIANLINKSHITVEYKSIPKAELKEYYPLSFTQRLMYMSQQLQEKSTAYNLTIALEFVEDLELEKLKNALKKLIERHEILRTSFHIINNSIVQKIEDKEFEDIPFIEAPREKVKYLIKESIRPFHLNKFPLYRIKIFKITSSCHVLLIDMHHIITDGASISILIKDLLALYKGTQLVPLEIQYKDYAEWNNKFLKSEAVKKQEAYWLNKFAGNIPKMSLPFDFPRPKVRDMSKAHQINFTIDTELTKKIKSIVLNNHTTLYTFLLSIFNILLHKYSGQRYITVGSPVANRPHPNLENNIGAFINMVALRNEISPENTFNEFLKQVAKVTIESFDNQDYQFEELLVKLGIQGETNRNPLFDCVFNLMPIENELKKATDSIIKPFNTGVALCKFDLQFVGYEIDDTILMNLKYSSELFKVSTAQMIIQHFMEIIQAVILNPEIQIDDIRLDQTLAKAEVIVNTVDFENDF
jgi:tyrocidine synthetase III